MKRYMHALRCSSMVMISPLLAMHPIPAERLKLAHDEMVKQMSSVISDNRNQIDTAMNRIFKGDEYYNNVIAECSYDDYVTAKVAIFHNYNARVVKIVEDEADLLTNQEKLHLLFGDGRRNKRKKIIKHMLEFDNDDPNTITEDGDHSRPLYNAVLHRDGDFVTYLVNHGVVVDDATAKLLEQEEYATIRAIFPSRS